VAVDGETDPESKPKVSSLELEVELTPGVDADPLAWPAWLSRASSVTARKPAAAAATAIFFAPAARRRAASILVGGLVTVRPQRRVSRPSSPCRSQPGDAAARSPGVGGAELGNHMRGSGWPLLGSGWLLFAAFTFICGLLRSTLSTKETTGA
jgi:hypothetical protein